MARIRTRLVRVRDRAGRIVTKRIALGASTAEYGIIASKIASDVVMPPPPPPPPPPQKRGFARLAHSLRGTSLGDDTVGAMDDQTFKESVLANQRELIESHKHWADGDRMQKWIAIGATLSIPLAGAIWRMLGVGRRRPR